MRRPPLALTYHSVACVPPSEDYARLAVAPKLLRKHILCLRRWGYGFTSASDLVRRATTGDGEGLVALTFDDGFADNLHALAPLLKDMGATATVFITTGWMGETHPDAPWARLMTADEIRELRSTGVEVGAHTVSHPDLRELAYGKALAELRDSRLALEELLQEPVTAGAYPYGFATAETVRAAREAGYEASLRTEGFGDPSDRLDFPRQAMGNSSTRSGLWLKRSGRYESAMRLLPFRAVRRLRLTALR